MSTMEAVGLWVFLTVIAAMLGAIAVAWLKNKIKTITAAMLVLAIPASFSVLNMYAYSLNCNFQFSIFNFGDCDLSRVIRPAILWMFLFSALAIADKLYHKLVTHRAAKAGKVQ